MELMAGTVGRAILDISRQRLPNTLAQRASPTVLCDTKKQLVMTTTLNLRALSQHLRGMSSKSRCNSQLTIRLMMDLDRSLMSPVVMLVVGEERTEFRAYEDILCRLPFFRAALLNGFKETTDKKITMPEDEPEIIAALLEFLYVGHYTYTFERDGIKPNSTPPCDLLEGSFHLRLYAAAFKYDCPGLVEAALKSVVYVLTHLDGIDVVLLLKESYDGGCDTALWDAGEDMASFKTKLPGILNRVFVTHSKGMKDIVFECPALSFDLLRLSVLAQ